MCAMWTLLVWLCCSRFEYYHFRTVTELILDVFKKPHHKRGFIKKFLKLYCASPNGIPPDRAFAPAKTCMAFRKSSHTFCENAPVGNGTYCKTHAQMYGVGNK